MFSTARRTNPTGYAHLSASTSEWGPARHDPEQPGLHDADASYGTALRDGDDAFPDDN